MDYYLLKDCCEILDSKRIPITAKDRKKGNYPYYGANGIQDYVEQYIFDDELVLLAEDGGNFGSKNKPIAYRVSGKCWVNNHAHVLKPKSFVDVDYLCYSLMFYNVENIITGATRKKLTQAAMNGMKIPKRDMSQQRLIVSIIKKVEDIITYHQNQLKLLDEFVKSRFVEMFGDPVINSKEWPTYELSKYIQFLTSGSRGWSQYFTDNGEYFITIKNVKNCKIMLNDVQYVIPPHNAEAKRTRVQEDDLLISITADLGRTGVVTKEIANHGGYINQHLTCVRLDQSAVRSLYVAFYMESEAGKRQFQTKNQSAVKAGLNFQSINTFRIMVPPIELQDSFIAFVKEIHKSRLAIQKSLDETQLLFDSLMQKYFG